MYVDLNIKFSSKKNTKALIYKALNIGYSIVAISINYDLNCKYDEKWKIVNCFKYNDIVHKSYNNETSNYFIDNINDVDIMNDYLLNINNNIEENFILINRTNTLCIKDVCDDFIFNKKNEITQEELKNVYNLLPSENFFLSNNNSTYVLKRLNIKYQDALKMENYNKYIKENNFDLIGIEVTSAEEINLAASKFDCDIIYFDLKKCFISLRKSDIQNALDRGIFFEISSLNTITEDYQYVILALNINNLFSVIPLNKLIFSSGSLKENEIIEPLHFLRLFFNFNTLSYKDVIQCITNVPISCIQRASVRKSLNTAVFFKSAETK
ncbi:ribonuclease P/MRP protein subunit RPP1, putative [Plasmodium gallinaceum]|uniref:Ribonuclease P/MRP protein subunit RPP1, putative n=1 Tax=Plasmodium gallinaceum TaxID=5849 RepID=A0A1J1GMW4_PLAGA|nr:ribonuclease P/MRP protein subunit RPP1, putative [Plasmodium gallinaceum]CRG93792.1 ribonuclease P/MRP protein subunit RPP1, putative [Plasmodium gallinaceum]